VYLVAAVLAPVIAPYDPLSMSAGPRLYPPNGVHWFGTDEFGRDVFSRVLYGARIAFVVGVTAALAAAIVGSTVGMIAGYLGGVVDRLVTMLILSTAASSRSTPGTKSWRRWRRPGNAYCG
jgi:peptide/nickel transport system permease protein